MVIVKYQQEIVADLVEVVAEIDGQQLEWRQGDGLQEIPSLKVNGWRERLNGGQDVIHEPGEIVVNLIE